MVVAAPPHVELAVDYARRVVDGHVLACKWVRLAAQRFLGDLERTDWPYHFDERRAERVCVFAEQMRHVKGEWANRGETIRLEPWQCFILVNVFGFVDDSGHRRFREVYIEVPRKNAKSSLSSVVALYMLAMDGEEGAGVYSAATTRDQARITFDDGVAMIEKNPDFRERYGLKPGKFAVAVPAHNATWKPITRESAANEGLNVHLGLLDELHAHKNRDVFGVIRQGMGARRQPLLWMITTAGSDQSGVCYEQRSGVARILEGTAGGSVELERIFGVIYTLDEGDNPWDPDVWPKSNPNLGVSVYLEDMAAAAAKAQLLPGERAEYLTKRHNIWVTALDPYFDASLWVRGRMPGWRGVEIPAALDGRRAFVALDFATRRDIAAMNIVFPLNERRYAVFGKYYLPQAAIQQSRTAAYSGWVDEGWITVTPGDTTDYSFIRRDLLEWVERFRIDQVAYDPREARQFAAEMENEHGVAMEEIRQGYASYNEPMKELDALIVERRVHHSGDPVLAWAIGNVVARRGAYGDVMPDREGEDNKIDPAVATLMALAQAMVAEGDADWWVA